MNIRPYEYAPEYAHLWICPLEYAAEHIPLTPSNTN